MTGDEARVRFAAARVARLATVDEAGRPHLVPVVFALVGSRIYTAVDAKPKRHKALRRLANIRANPRVALLVDQYDEDWAALWWVRADGVAEILADSAGRSGIDALVARYAQYRKTPPPGPVIAIDVDHWSAWSAADLTGGGVHGWRR
jgi:PPOX class probable F420-dependent enzyme